jgi:Fe-S cluster biogenesis protein NfuA
MGAVQEQPAAELVAEVEARLAELETLPDPRARDVAGEAMAALLALYGAGLARLCEEIAAVDDGRLAAALADDELVSHLLLVHGLHPVSLEDRVAGALDSVRPYLSSHGGGVELLGVEEPEVRLLLQGSCSGCPSSRATLTHAIEAAIRRAAPEIETVVAREAPRAEPPPVQIEWTQCLPMA